VLSAGRARITRMYQDALLESAPVLLRRPYRDTGRGKTLAKPFARASPTPTRHVVPLAKMEAARRARLQNGIAYACLIAIPTMAILLFSILLFR